MPRRPCGFVLSMILLVGACSGGSDPNDESDARLGDMHVNPEFECPTAEVVETDMGYPHPVLQYPHSEPPERSVAELQAFCRRVQELFADSGLTESEARRVYAAIPTVLAITDDPVGMPSSDDPPQPPVDLTSRVMLRKIDEDIYEIFYYTFGCGRNYFVYEIDLSGQGARARPVEAWSESQPC